MKRKYTRRSRAQWEALIKRQRSSGQTVQAFCEAAGLKPSSFHYWQRKLSEEPSPPRQGFVPVVTGSAPGRMVLRGRRGVVAEVPCDLPAGALHNLIEALSC